MGDKALTIAVRIGVYTIEMVDHEDGSISVQVSDESSMIEFEYSELENVALEALKMKQQRATPNE